MAQKLQEAEAKVEAMENEKLTEQGKFKELAEKQAIQIAELTPKAA